LIFKIEEVERRMVAEQKRWTEKIKIQASIFIKWLIFE